MSYESFHTSLRRGVGIGLSQSENLLARAKLQVTLRDGDSILPTGFSGGLIIVLFCLLLPLFCDGVFQ